VTVEIGERSKSVRNVSMTPIAKRKNTRCGGGSLLGT
jgi:hypothetical protein